MQTKNLYLVIILRIGSGISEGLLFNKDGGGGGGEVMRKMYTKKEAKR